MSPSCHVLEEVPRSVVLQHDVLFAILDFQRLVLTRPVYWVRWFGRALLGAIGTKAPSLFGSCSRFNGQGVPELSWYRLRPAVAQPDRPTRTFERAGHGPEPFLTAVGGCPLLLARTRCRPVLRVEKPGHPVLHLGEPTMRTSPSVRRQSCSRRRLGAPRLVQVTKPGLSARGRRQRAPWESLRHRPISRSGGLRGARSGSFLEQRPLRGGGRRLLGGIWPGASLEDRVTGPPGALHAGGRSDHRVHIDCRSCGAA